MNDGYIAILDSGIGGLSVLSELLRIMPNEKYLYFGDNDNAPYGNRTFRDLLHITFKSIDAIKRYNIKALVIGCNTLSTTIFDYIADYACVPTFGTFPPIEQALLRNEKILLLATERTASVYKDVGGVSTIGLKTLARDIERNMFNLDSVDFEENLYNNENVRYGETNIDNIHFNTVVLGCTHYFFVKNKIFDHFRPQKLVGGNYFTAKSVFEFLRTSKSLVNYNRKCITFVGKNSETNREFFIKSGQKM